MKTLILISLLLLGCAKPSEQCEGYKTCVPYIKFDENGNSIKSYWNRCLQAEVDLSQCNQVEIK